jgi:hypothetical protein
MRGHPAHRQAAASVFDQAVANAGLSLEVAGPVRVGFQLLAKVGHVDAKVMSIFFRVGSPYLAQDMAVGDNATAVEDQDTKERVLARGELHIGSFAADGAGDEVDGDVAENDRRLIRGGGRAAKNRAEAGEELFTAEWFGEIVVSAGIERGDFVGLGGDDSKHEHGHTRPLAKTAQNIEAGQIRQAEVEHHGIGGATGDFIETEAAGLRLADGVPGGFEREAEQAAKLHLIVNDEDVVRGGGRLHSAGTLA